MVAPGGITGRPVRALSVLGALLLGWLAGHWPLFEQDVAAAVERVHAVQLMAALPASPPAIRVAPAVQLATLPLLAAPPVALAAAFESSFLRPVTVAPAAPQRRARPGRASSSRLLEVGWMLPPGTVRTSPVVPSRRASTAFNLATAAYTALAAGDRRAAANGFADAISANPLDPRVAQWRAQRRLLTRRWSGSAYTFVRAAGSANPGAAPLLGGGQSGAALAWTPFPLARRPLSLTARTTSANDTARSDAEAAFGVRWQPFRGVSLSAERLVALGPGGRNDWTARLAAGGQAHRGKLEASAYGETGVVGIARPTIYAAAQARAGYRLPTLYHVSAAPGAGAWASIQHDRATTDRVDVGPGVVMRWDRAKLPLDIAVDYRFRVAGNAAPGSGVAVTVSTGF